MRQPSRSSISFAPEWSARARIASGVARTNTSKWTKPGSAAAHAAKTEARFILATGTTLHLVGVCANRTGVVDGYKKRNPNITTDQTEEILKVVRKSINYLEPSLENMFVEIYDSQFNDEQVDSLYTFHSTPIGAQIAEKQQNIATASALQAGTWGRSIWAPEIANRLQSDDALKGLDLRWDLHRPSSTVGGLPLASGLGKPRCYK